MATMTFPIDRMLPLARAGATAVVMSAAIIAGSLAAAHADPAVSTTLQMTQATPPQNPAAAGATETKGETVEQRITSLRTALQITPDQATKWDAVAQAMRQNETAMSKLIAETRTTSPQSVSAVDDLDIYRKFAQAHIDGLKNLIDDFKILYDSMPAGQKEIADTVFRTSRD